jgi:hypothetical protein
MDSGIKETPISLQITFPNSEIPACDTTMPGETRMESVLWQTCEKTNLDFDAYTLILSVTPYLRVLIDKPLKDYATSNSIHLDVLKGEKFYETLCIKEGDKDVMIIRNEVDQGVLVMASTIDKIIERITDEDVIDQAFLDTTLMCFRNFIKPNELLDQLIARFDAELPENPSADDLAYFTKHKVHIQRKVLNVITSWVDKHWHDFGLDEELKNELEIFISDYLVDSREFQHEARGIVSSIGDQSSRFEVILGLTREDGRRRKTLQTIFHDHVDPEALGQELCLFDFDLFEKIHPIEYLRQIWGGAKSAAGETLTPALDHFISRFDGVSYWVCTELVMVKDLKKRASILKTFIYAARVCRCNLTFPVLSKIQQLFLNVCSTSWTESVTGPEIKENLGRTLGKYEKGVCRVGKDDRP